MEEETLKLKLHLSKLQRECLEKYSEIQALRKQNEELRETAKKVRDHSKDSMDIIFQLDSPSKGNMTARSFGQTGGILMMNKATERDVRIHTLAKMFSGSFTYDESSYNLVPNSKWEFVIVCPNPDNCDLMNSIGKIEGQKYFRKGFKPEFSKKLNTLRINQTIESNAFTKIFDLLPLVGNEVKFKGGGRFECSDSKIIDKQEITADYLTLMRNVLLVKLGLHLGLHTKQVMSSNGKYIYILVCAEDKDLENEAEAINYNLEMEIGEIDLQSLEPCDENLRPFRVLDSKKDPIKTLLNEITIEFPEIMDLFKVSDGEECTYEPYGVWQETWEVYRVYLLEFQKGVRNLKEKGFDAHTRNICLQKIIKNSMIRANNGQIKKFRLRCLWDCMGFTKALSPYFDYIRNFDPITGEDKFAHIWKRYPTQNRGRATIFRNIDRLKLLTSLINRQADIHYLAQKEIINCSFPLKNEFELSGIRQFKDITEDPDYIDAPRALLTSLYEEKPQGLLRYWSPKIACRNLPINKIRNYFGEKIGFYFAFIFFFSNLLSIPSLIGLVVFILQRIYEPESNIVIIANVLYCIYVSAWATFFIEFWKRKESCLAIKWGQTDFKEDEVPRPQFQGINKRSPIDDDMDDIYFNPLDRYKFYVFSAFVTLIFIGIVIIAVIAIIFLRISLSNRLEYLNIDFVGPICSCLNALQIQILNIIFNKIAVKLNNLENHRTQSDYESSLIIKCYVFQFVNSFFSLFYISFLKTNFEGCPAVDDNGKRVHTKGASCVDELYTQFITIFIISFLKNGVELGLPYISAKQKEIDFKKVRSSGSIFEEYTAATDIEVLRDLIDKQFQLPAYITRDVDGTLGDYLEIAILYGYITLFAVAFPLSGVIAFLAVVAEIYVDRFKLLYMVRRPVPLGAKDISNWKTIFLFMSVASIVTNSALICFTFPTFDKWEIGRENKLLIYLVFVVVMLLIRAAISSGVQDTPLKYQTIVKRHNKIIQRFIKGWDIVKSKSGSANVYVNPNIYCTHRITNTE